MAKLTFEEKQKFNQPLLLIPIVGMAVMSIVWLIMQLVVEQPVGNHPMPDAGLIILCVTLCGSAALLLSMRLHTRIDENGIAMRYAPFLSRKWSWSELRSAEVLDYGFVGGWGIRFWTSYGTVYNVRGSKGLAIKLRNGRKLLIGTQKPAEMKQAVELHMPLPQQQ